MNKRALKLLNFSSVVHCHACLRWSRSLLCCHGTHKKFCFVWAKRVSVPKPRKTKQEVKCIGKSIIAIVQKKSLFPSGRYGFCGLRLGSRRRRLKKNNPWVKQAWRAQNFRSGSRRSSNWRIRRRRARNWITRRAKRSRRSGAFALTGCLILQILWSEYLFCQDISFWKL